VLEEGASEAATLRARVAALEHSLTLVRQAAGAAAMPLGALGGELQSALSGFAGQPHAHEGALAAAAARPTQTGQEMVVDSRGQGARKRGRPAGAAAAGRRPSALAPAARAERSPSPEPLPPPLSPLSPHAGGGLPPPLSPLPPPRGGAAQDAAPAAAPRPAVGPLKRPNAKPRAPAPPPAAPAPPPAPPAPRDELLRAVAVPLGKAAARGKPPAAAAADTPHARDALDASVPPLDAAHAPVEAAAACVTSEAGVCASLHDAARDGPDAATAAARGLAAAVLTRTVSPAALLAGVLAFARSDAACVPTGLPAAVLELDAALARARQSGRGGAVRLLGSGVADGFADAVAAALRNTVNDAALGRGSAAAAPVACAAVALMRARQQLQCARTLLLDVLQYGSGAGGASSPLAGAACGALHAWPGLLAGRDPMAVAAAAVLRDALRDAPEGTLESLQLPPPLDAATPTDALEVALAWLQRAAEGRATPDALHSAVRGLELIASHAGASRLLHVGRALPWR
jgi:hypothetical protein